MTAATKRSVGNSASIAPPNGTAQAAFAEGDLSDPASPVRARRPGAAKHLRRALKPQLARELRVGAEESAVSYAQLGDALDMSKQRVGRFAHADFDDVPSVVHARLSPGPLAARLAKFIAEPHGLLVEPAPDCEHGDNHAARLCALTAESTDVLRTVTAALVDGAFSADELDAFERELNGELRAVREALAWVVKVRAGMGSR